MDINGISEEGLDAGSDLTRWNAMSDRTGRGSERRDDLGGGLGGFVDLDDPNDPLGTGDERM